MKPDNPFYGKSVAVTGKLGHYTRDNIKARLQELGARPVSKVSRRTDYLILGERPGSKLAKALAFGICILSEREFEDMTNTAPSSTNGDYGPSNPWDAPGMSVSDFI